MAEVYQEDKPSLPIIEMSIKQVLQVLLLGFVVGLLTWVISYILERYVLKTFLCGDGQVGCTVAASYSYIVAAVIAAAAGLFGLVKLLVYRPLLIVLAATVAVWGVVQMLVMLPVYIIVLSTAVLSALAYVTFAWFAHVRLFWLAVIIMVAIVVATRFVLMA